MLSLLVLAVEASVGIAFLSLFAAARARHSTLAMENSVQRHLLLTSFSACNLAMKQKLGFDFGQCRPSSPAFEGAFFPE